MKEGGVVKLSLFFIVLLSLMPFALALDDLVSFTYSDTSGNFNGVDSFSALNKTITEGDVSRLYAPGDSAVFNFASPNISSANVELLISVEDITPWNATGSGTITLLDIDGDSIEANVNGIWVRIGQSANFVGLLENAQLSSGDGTFDGTSGSPFSTTFPHETPFMGNILTLTFQGWFTNSSDNIAPFNDKTTLINGVVTGELPDEEEECEDCVKVPIMSPVLYLLLIASLALMGWYSYGRKP